MANGSYSAWCSPLAMNPSAMTKVGQPAEAWCSMAVTLPPSPNAMRRIWIEGERNESKRISSARVSSIFTGLPSAFAASAAGTVVVAREFGEADDVLVLDRLGDRLAQANGKVLEIERAKHRRLHAIEAFSYGRACPRRGAAQA